MSSDLGARRRVCAQVVEVYLGDGYSLLEHLHPKQKGHPAIKSRLIDDAHFLCADLIGDSRARERAGRLVNDYVKWKSSLVQQTNGRRKVRERRGHTSSSSASASSSSSSARTGIIEEVINVDEEFARHLLFFHEGEHDYVVREVRKHARQLGERDDPQHVQLRDQVAIICEEELMQTTRSGEGELRYSVRRAIRQVIFFEARSIRQAPPALEQPIRQAPPQPIRVKSVKGEHKRKWNSHADPAQPPTKHARTDSVASANNTLLQAEIRRLEQSLEESRSSQLALQLSLEESRAAQHNLQRSLDVKEKERLHAQLASDQRIAWLERTLQERTSERDAARNDLAARDALVERLQRDASAKEQRIQALLSEGNALLARFNQLQQQQNQFNA